MAKKTTERSANQQRPRRRGGLLASLRRTNQEPGRPATGLGKLFGLGASPKRRRFRFRRSKPKSWWRRLVERAR